MDPYSGEKKVRINPNLTEELLNKLTEQTRRLIIELYIKCEEDYVKGVKLFEAIVESKIMETTQKQLNSLEETMENLTNKSTDTSTSTSTTTFTSQTKDSKVSL